MQIVAQTKPNGRFLVQVDDQGETLKTMRVATEHRINSMSAGSLHLYRNVVRTWRGQVHEHGTPEAIRTIDYLHNAICRASRTQPVC